MNPRISATSALISMSLLSTAALAAPEIPFPVNGDGAQVANIIRQYDGNGLLTTTGVALDGPGVNHSGYQPINAFDGAGEKLQWNGTTAADPTESGSLLLTLNQIYSIRTFYHEYLDPGYRPAAYKIEVSTTGFGSMTTAVSGGLPLQQQKDVLGAPVNAQYIRYSWQGTAATQYVLLQEFEAFANAATTNPPLMTGDGYDIIALQGAGPIVTTDITPGKWVASDLVTNATDRNHFSYLRGNGVGDAAFTVDLSLATQISAISLGYYQGQEWGNGVNIVGSLDGVNYNIPLFDSAVGTTSYLSIALPGQPLVRYLQVTNKGGAGGALTDIQVFGIPEPTSMGMLALGALALMHRSRRRCA